MKKRLYQALLGLVLSASVAVGGFFAAVPQTAYAQNVATASESGYHLADNVQDGVILHCFDWTYQQIIDELPDIAKAGFSSVQTSPAQLAVKGNSIWYYLYQPNCFAVGDSGLGSEADLKRLCTEADKYGIKVIVDVVANHLAGDHSNIDSDLKGSEYWNHAGSNINYKNRLQITHGDIGMPDLNSENWLVQQKVSNYVQQLKNDGVDGIRWDAAKHISLPSEDCGFWSTVIDKSMYNYGEILVGAIDENEVDQRTASNINWMKEYTSYMSVTDSNYGNDVINAFNSGRVPSGFGSWVVSGLSEDTLVYWAESHDTYANDGGSTKYVDQNKIDRAYAIVGSRDGASALYFSRPAQTDKEKIMVGQKGSTHFESAEVAAVNHLHNVCIDEEDYYTTTSDLSAAAVVRESGACVVLGSGGNREVTIANGGLRKDGSYTRTTPGVYYDEITGNKFTVTQDTISGEVGSTGIAVFYKDDNGHGGGSGGSGGSETSETRDIYLDVTNCSWFGCDSAVAAIKTDKDTTFSKMTTTVTTDTNKTVYTAKVPKDATSATIVRMLPSGKYYNEKTITLNQSYNRYTSDGNWLSLTTDLYNTQGGSGETQTGINVYFTNNYNWSNVYAYTWGGDGKQVQWPGEKMTYVGQNEYQQSVYTLQISADCKGLIFTNGSGAQTVDITSGIKENGGYYISGNASGKYSVGTYTYQK